MVQLNYLKLQQNQSTQEPTHQRAHKQLLKHSRQMKHCFGLLPSLKNGEVTRNQKDDHQLLCTRSMLLLGDDCSQSGY